MIRKQKIYNIIQRAFISIITISLIISLFTCSEDEENVSISSKTAVAKLEIPMAPSRIAIEDINRVRLIVSGDGMETIDKDLFIDKNLGKATGNADVPLGNDRLFRVEVYANNFLRYVGEQRSNVRDAISLKISVGIKPAEGVGVIAIGEQAKGSGLVIALGDVNIFLLRTAGNIRFIQNLAKSAGISPKLKIDISHGTELTQPIINELEKNLREGGFQTKIDESFSYDKNSYGAILFALPKTAFSFSQLNEIIAFVNNGGMLILVADIDQPLEALNQLASKFGLSFSYSLVNVPGNSPDSLILSNLSTQPLFDGVGGIAISYARSIEVAPSPIQNINIYNSATPGAGSITTPDEPKLLVTPNEINLGTILLSGQVDIGNSGTGNISWNVKKTDIPSWLTISPESGKATSGAKQNVSIKANRNGIAPGEYRYTLKIESNAGEGSILVIMSVPEPSPLLFVSTKSVSFGSSTTQSTFFIRNDGGGTLDWRIAKQQSWLTANSTNGSLGKGQSRDIALSVNRTNISPGTYSDTITITYSEGVENVTVSMTVPESPPVISVSKSSINFGGVTAQDTFIVNNIGGGSLIWQTAKQQSWLSLNPSSGSTNNKQPTTVTLDVNRANLKSGTYRDVISISSNGGSASVEISMTVPELPPVLAINPTSADFDKSATSKTFSITNDGEGILNWEASKTQSWLTISLESGSLTALKSVSIALNVNRAGLNPGTYKDTVSISSNGGNGNVAVTMTVPEPDPKPLYTPTSIDFGINLSQQSFTITNDGGGILTWQASNLQKWLSINPASGSLKGGVSVTVNLIVNREGQKPGTYRDNVSLVFNGATGNISVSITVPELSPKLAYSPDSFNFEITNTQNTVSIKNEGGGALTWQASNQQAWLSLNPKSGSLNSGQSANIALTINRLGLTPNSYNDTIKLTSNGGEGSIRILMAVPEPAPVLSYLPQSADFGTTLTQITFTINNNGGGTLNWSSSKQANWLNVVPTNGSLTSGKSSTVTLIASRTNLNPGVYRDIVSLDSNGGKGSITITMTIPEPSPKLAYTPSSRDFGDKETQLTVSISNSGGQNLTWNATNKETWLKISPANGSLTMGQSTTMTLSINKTGLKPGSYRDVIALASNGGEGSISVSMIVPEPPPSLQFSPNAMDFGSSQAQLQLAITNTGGGTLNWQSSEQLDWLTLAPVSGSVFAGQTMQVSVSVSRLGLQPNTYTGNVSINSNGGNGNISISMKAELTIPSLSFTPSALDFGKTDTQKTFTISNSGGGTLTWQISSQQSWLTISPVVGSLDAGKSVTITVNVSRVRLDPGAYKDNIAIRTNSANGNVAVSMTIPEPPPALSFTPPIVDFGDTDTQKAFTITNSGGETLTWSIKSSLTWLTFPASSGSLTLGKSANITVSANRAALKPGSYTGTIDITTNGGNGKVTVNLSMPGLSLSPTSYAFATSDTQATITIKNSGAGILRWNATNTSTWLALSAKTGTVNAGASSTITATVNRSGLTPNDYKDTISFTSNGGSGNVDISMSIPKLAYNPTSLSFNASETQKTLVINNTGGGTLKWSATKRQAWLTLSPINGEIRAGSSINVIATVSRTGVAPGTQSDTIFVKSDGGDANIPVSMLVSGFLVSASNLDFGSTEDQKILNLTNNGAGVLDWSATKKESWLTIEPAKGQLDAGRQATINVKVSRTGLKPEKYTDTIIFASNAGERRVVVNMSVPGLSYNPTALNFGASSTRLNLAITNIGGGSLSWSATKTQNWLTISPTSGFVSEGGTSNIAVSVSRVGLAPISYKDVLSLVTNGGNADINVSMDVAKLSTKPESFTFNPTKTRDTLAISNIGTGVLTWNATKVNDWLTITPTSGSINAGQSANVAVSVNIANVNSGTYTDNIAITSNGGNINIPVTLGMPQLIVVTTLLNFGSTNILGNFDVTNSGGGVLTWKSSVKEPWLTVTPSGGTVNAGESTNVTVRVSRTELKPGTYTDDVIINSDGGNDSVAILMHVAGLSFSPTSLNYTANEVQKTVTIKNIGSGILTWQAVDNQAWLTLNPTSGSVNADQSATFTATVSRVGLTEGTYNANIIIVSNGGNGQIPVTMIVENPKLSLSVAELNFGSRSTAGAFQVSNIGGGTLNWNIDSAKLPSWLRASPLNGSNVSGTPTTVNVTVSRQGLDPGTYRATIPINSNGGNGDVAVIMTVSGPTISVTPAILDFGRTNDNDSFLVGNVGGGVLDWNISPNNYPGWLSLEPLSGSENSGDSSKVYANVYRDRMDPGIYTHDLVINSNGGTGTIRITMTVPEPSLSVSPTRLDFGLSTVRLQFTITNEGGGTLVWTATADRPWMTLSRAVGEVGARQIQGATGPYSSTVVYVTVNRINMPGGNYTGNINISSNGGSAGVAVTMQVPIIIID